MKKFLSKYFPAIPTGVILITLIFSHSCANTKQAPTGGDKDSIPPIIVKVNPLPGETNVTLQGMQFSFTFNEYVKVKDAKNIFLSPPSDKPLKYKMHGKTLTVYSETDLLPNTTYSISFNGAIQDNNEGNDFPGYTYVFSTGENIDTMMLTGIVQDCSTLEPVKDATVLLYKDHSDSAVFLRRPFAAVKTDQWGYFAIRNIPDTLYRIYAIKDLNSDNKYDPATEYVAFIDSLIRPVNVVNDTILELAYLDMKDTVNCLARKTEYELNLFREKNAKQMIKNQGRVSDRAGFVSFSAQRAHIDTMWVGGITADRLITQFNKERDSLELWINDQRKMPDTLNVFVNYRKTDTTGMLVPFTENVKLYVEGVGKKSSKKPQINHEDTTCVLQLKAVPETFEQIGYEIEFKYPIIKESFDSLKFYAVNPKQQEIPGKFKVTRDSVNLRVYHIMPEGEILAGYDYFLKVPHRGFRDINGYYNDSTQVSVAIPQDETLSTLILDLKGVNNKYIIDLQDEKKTNILRTYVIDAETSLAFPYLKSGKYSIRITEDKNRNSLVDVGDILGHILPEKVKYYKLDDNSQITIPESSEIVQEIYLSELFKN